MVSVIVTNKNERLLSPQRLGRGHLGQRSRVGAEAGVAGQRQREGMEGRKVIPSASVDQRSTISDTRLAISD